MARQIVLDTETTGLSAAAGDRIIEIGCVELVNRRLTGNNLHLYLNPERDSHEDALKVHGISNEFLRDKPRFAEVVDDILAYLEGAELIIHNAAFDRGFIDYELSLLGAPPRKLADYCVAITDTLELARRKHPGQKNNLDALCKRYQIDNSHRELHGALLDARILADVYIRMTGGQASLVLQADDNQEQGGEMEVSPVSSERRPLRIVRALPEELAAHEQRLDSLQKAAGTVLWRTLAQRREGRS